MLDPRLFRSDLDYIRQQLDRRSFQFDTDGYVKLEAQRKDIQVKTQDLQNERNNRSKLIGHAKASGQDI
ncbi:MAG: serine--tRNA ligase, partial [Methylicorpusculum sp.]|nr:serine--tRNA ligase [Methylicorpusculum sp.]